MPQVPADALAGANIPDFDDGASVTRHGRALVCGHGRRG